MGDGNAKTTLTIIPPNSAPSRIDHITPILNILNTYVLNIDAQDTQDVLSIDVQDIQDGGQLIKW